MPRPSPLFRSTARAAALLLVTAASSWAAAPTKAAPAAVPAPAAPACPTPGAPTAAFSFPLPLSGDRVSLNSLKSKDKPIVLAFWAYSCGPCILELPALQKLSSEWGDRVSVVLVHVGGCGDDAPAGCGEQKMRDALDKWQITLPAALDESKKISGEKYCVKELPRLLVLDGAGTVKGSFGALGAGFEATVRAEVARLLR